MRLEFTKNILFMMKMHIHVYVDILYSIVVVVVVPLNAQVRCSSYVG